MKITSCMHIWRIQEEETLKKSVFLVFLLSKTVNKFVIKFKKSFRAPKLKEKIMALSNNLLDSILQISDCTIFYS